MIRSLCQLSDSRVSHHVFVGGLLGTGPVGVNFGVKNISFGAQG